MGTALPSIVHELQGTDSFAWVSAAYTLSTTAVLPLNGRLAEIFGRRDVLLSGLLLFAVGSVVCARAESMTVLIVGRAIQGLGSGGIQTLTTIVVSDLVPLKERGLYNGITGATFTIATGAGPFLGGAIVQKTTWRWLFYLNLPLAGIAVFVVLAFLKLRKPARPPVRTILSTVDWIGNTLIIASTASCVIALTWAGIKFPWTSANVLCPLIIGVAGLVGAVLYNVLYAAHPTLPLRIMSNRTSLAGYFGSAIHALVITSVNFYLPVYFQAAKVASPILSGVYIFPFVAVLSPAAIVQGIVVAKYGCYRLMNVLGWCLMLIGVGLMLLLNPDTPIGVSVPFQMIASVGLGFLYATTFSVLAPLDVTDNAAALAFLLFCRTFPQSWSISIGASVLQNKLRSTLPATFIQQFTSDEDITYIAIPLIKGLEEPLQRQCRQAFADSMHLLWKILLVLCAVGLLSVGLQRNIDLHSKTDSRWGMADKKEKSASPNLEDIERVDEEKEAPSV
ncbi:MFS general substrate transporter [Collybia nuda]|uniref:MFS general substrate transporter n=1 Tax=Collybia nuda TaxID=64659 RepID=A0A9P5Y2R7_9AGAR|nr:MFS general substrate transporter [Collybia nuda]